MQLRILSVISKQISKIVQNQLKIVKKYVGENRNIALLKKPRSKAMFHYFANFGYLSLMKEARLRGYQWDEEDVCLHASYRGKLDILKYLHESGCKFTTACIDCAAYSSTECIKYLHSIGCQWSKEACANAASAGSLERLKYLHENGCTYKKMKKTVLKFNE